MARLNLTLDDDTFAALERDAHRERARLATYATRLLKEALERRERERRWRTWEDAYRAGAADDRRLLADMEGAQLDVVGDEAD